MFKQRVSEIKAHNANPQKTFTLAANQFAAYTEEELESSMLGAIPDEKELEKVVEVPRHKHHSKKATVPKAKAVIKNWATDLGLTNTVRSQGRCGSCWAFATATNIDYNFNIRDSSSILVSSQQLLACSYSVAGIDVQGGRRYRGCNGGWLDKPFYYSMTHLLASDSDYPYTRSSWCNLDNAAKGQYQIESYSRLASNGVCDGLADHLTNVGTAVITFKVISTFYSYSSGVYSCTAGQRGINHAMVAVGVTDTAYIIQNSWGTGWGNGGFVEVTTDPATSCNLCLVSPFISTVAAITPP